jgi:DNA polymerase-3 subunit gamma/tau
MDPRRFAMDLLERLRDLIIVAAVPDGWPPSVLRGVPEDQLDRMRGQQSRFRAGNPVAGRRHRQRGHHGDDRGHELPRMQLELICARVLLPGGRRRAVGMPPASTASNVASTALPPRRGQGRRQGWG